MKFTTREGSKAAYVNSLFRIENVIFVTSLRDTASKQKDEKRRERKQPRSFESVLEEACSDRMKYLFPQTVIPKTALLTAIWKNEGNMYTEDGYAGCIGETA